MLYRAAVRVGDRGVLRAAEMVSSELVWGGYC